MLQRCNHTRNEEPCFKMSHAFLQSEDVSETGTTHEEEVNDFGIGTLVLAMALGTVSRIYITSLTG